MQTVRIPAETTVDMVSQTLSDHFPGIIFAVSVEEESGGRRDLRGIDIVWVDGPRREEAESLLDRFQGVSWDPRTGSLESRTHLQIGPSGDLEQVCYDVDYIFCDGPTTVLFR